MLGQTEEEFDTLRADTRRKFGKYIKYVKDYVGHEYEYTNDMVRVVLSERGAYYEFINLPEEFCGIMGAYEHAFVDTKTCLSTIGDIISHVAQNPDGVAEEFTILTMYGMNSRDCYAAQYNPCVGGVQEYGVFRMGEIPKFHKMTWKKGADGNLILPYTNGLMFFVGNIGDRHMLVKAELNEFATDLTQAVEKKAVN